ncbi:5-(carboxyamino)imidazole ribonucleotide synthase [Pseudonocardia autotrophica]|uniref:N5-carboxyaminoimidazole ribonucleotide synthase n=3 Tax=Pseudonocardiaceae TaxID=2070 RepID=A0A1Y2MS92_PSEAH|nr:N5-carboxyaminoimidazole ribonucleotide synthase [Pseudonocardia autotrophica]TDN73709.1 5-(carboxyamino)imidazole ribonucleotide synthase [Pseudonocardia autotrophica]BBG04452.1 N5-carboxyaminoimidazole ribonucleotide synthase [Pseudonocardia autotrophica]GEC27302.1 N5-carboxyaminoimidazole ribonucleotide synthase [Pseudonocardia saturnea]
MVGGGQLARMTAQAAVALGQTLRVLAASPDDPAARVTPDVVIGDPDDGAALRELATGCSAVTFDHEGVPQEVLRPLAEAGIPLRPPPEALLHAQDKLVMRRRLSAMGLPMPQFAPVAAAADVDAFGAAHGWPVVLKATRGGYDGRGVWFLTAPDAALVTDLLDRGTPLMVESAVPMVRELAASVARSPFGQAAAWPVVETLQVDGQCARVTSPAPGLADDDAARIQEMALRIAAELGVVGLMTVELFETAPGEVVINELAMRPHNSGHWTIEGSVTSQFEQHLRAVLDYPLGATTPVAPVAVMANVLGAPEEPTMSMDERLHHCFARFPDARVHLYAKDGRPARKIGHVTVLGSDGEAVRERAELAADWLATAQWADGWSAHADDPRKDS